jgi:hypothetical protein
MRLRNYLQNLPNDTINTISKGHQPLTGEPGPCVPKMGECDHKVSISVTHADHGEKES